MIICFWLTDKKGEIVPIHNSSINNWKKTAVIMAAIHDFVFELV